MLTDLSELGTCRVLLPAPYDRAEWLALRHTGIGGSETAAVLGLDVWKSTYEVWLDKRGELGKLVAHDIEPGPEDPRYWGNLLEDDITEAFEDHTGLTARGAPGLLASNKHPWMLASPDRLVYDGNELAGVLECKSTGPYYASEWADDEVPIRALLQTHHYLMVTGLPRAWIAGLIGGQRFVCREIEPDPDLHEKIRAAEEDFWISVQSGRVPSPDGSRRAGEAVRRRWPRATDDDDGMVLSPDDFAKVQGIRDLTASLKALKTKKDALAQQLQDALGTYATGVYDDRPVVRWSNVTTNRLDQAALKADHPELVEKYTKPMHTRRFAIADKEVARGNQ